MKSLTPLLSVVIIIGLTTAISVILAETISSKLQSNSRYYTNKKCSGGTIFLSHIEMNKDKLFYRYINITNPTNTNLTDFQMNFTIDTQSLISSGKIKQDCSDVKITYLNGTEEVEIPIWVDKTTCNTNKTLIWVRIPKLDSNSLITLVLYYGNDTEVDKSKLWDNISFLGIRDGVFHYNITDIQRLNGEMRTFQVGRYHRCFINTNHNVICSGRNDYGQSASYLEGNAISVAVGEYHTCVLTIEGNVICYGRNNYGQSENYTNNNAIGVCAGVYHTCVLTNSGNVLCYGNSVAYQNYTNGDAIGLTCGWFHTCVLTNNGNVICSGNDGYHQARNYYGGDAIGVTADGYTTCVLKSNGDLDCYGNNEHGQANDYYGKDAIEVANGMWHTCILRYNGTVYCYGYNTIGQVNPYELGNAISISASLYSTCILKPDGNIKCNGRGYYGEWMEYNGGDVLIPFIKYQNISFLSISMSQEFNKTIYRISVIGRNMVEENITEMKVVVKSEKDFITKNIIFSEPVEYGELFAINVEVLDKKPINIIISDRHCGVTVERNIYNCSKQK